MTAAQQDYLDLMKMILTDFHHVGRVEYRPLRIYSWRTRLLHAFHTRLLRVGYAIVRPEVTRLEDRMEGLDWPQAADSMIGMKRMQNIESCMASVLNDGVPGDFIETGVWRGGGTIMMRAVLKAFGVCDRMVWVADSFEGLPAPDTEKYPEDRGDEHYRQSPLAVSLEEVKANFAKYGLLDDQVKFLKGWFADTLPSAPIAQLAVLRLDGDMYGSTMDALEALYPKLSPGGYCIVDDYHAVQGCRKAIHDYRSRMQITEPIEEIDRLGVFWRKSRSSE
jgi:O-methyltransferase